MHKILQQQLCTHPCKLWFFPNLCSILSKRRKSSDESLCTKTQQQQQQNVPVLVHCDRLLYQGHMTCHVAWSQANTEAFHCGIVHSLDMECNPLEKNRKEICIQVWSRKKQTLRKLRKRNLSSSSSSSSSLHKTQFTKEGGGEGQSYLRPSLVDSPCHRRMVCWLLATLESSPKCCNTQELRRRGLPGFVQAALSMSMLQ